MVTVDSNCHICMNRGDTLKLPVFINAAGDKLQLIRYTLQPDDRLYFCVAEPLQKWEDALIRKVYTVENLNERGDVVISLDTIDTEYLSPGTYSYEIKLVKVKTILLDGTIIPEEVTTVVPRKKFIIME